MGSTPPQRTLTERVAEFLARGPSPEEIARFRISERAQEQVHALMERHEDGALSSEETAELDEITVLDQLFTLIRARLAPPSSSAHNGIDA
ncbi:MAG TPA: hypothetical protein VIC85_04390 [Ktedonobacterales bacterium]